MLALLFICKSRGKRPSVFTSFALHSSKCSGKSVKSSPGNGKNLLFICLHIITHALQRSDTLHRGHRQCDANSIVHLTNTKNTPHLKTEHISRGLPRTCLPCAIYLGCSLMLTNLQIYWSKVTVKAFQLLQTKDERLATHTKAPRRRKQFSCLRFKNFEDSQLFFKPLFSFASQL